MRKFGMSGSSMKEERSGRAEEVRFLTTLMKCDYMLPKIVLTRRASACRSLWAGILKH